MIVIVVFVLCVFVERVFERCNKLLEVVVWRKGGRGWCLVSLELDEDDDDDADDDDECENAGAGLTDDATPKPYCVCSAPNADA